MASETLTQDERGLLDRLAARVVELRMELPAILTLESGKPLSLLAGQALIFFEPFIQTVFSFPDYRRFAQLIERREAVEALIQSIERHADDARLARQAAKAGAARTPPEARG
ncbi:MAG TPA: hypothetical protein VFQ05_13165 [Candidatus Eisenbacteria bacterium]|nr:hypothetical protein [Candidatus Eisenbacteria bacterium]